MADWGTGAAPDAWRSALYTSHQDAFNQVLMLDCCYEERLEVDAINQGLDHGIGHFMLFEVGSAARAPFPPIPVSRQTSRAASDRKSAPLPSSRQAESEKSCAWR